jgi:hypothetical protein
MDDRVKLKFSTSVCDESRESLIITFLVFCFSSYYFQRVFFHLVPCVMQGSNISNIFDLHEDLLERFDHFFRGDLFRIAYQIFAASRNWTYQRRDRMRNFVLLQMFRISRIDLQAPDT